jgi:hypothetical protein
LSIINIGKITEVVGVLQVALSPQHKSSGILVLQLRIILPLQLQEISQMDYRKSKTCRAKIFLTTHTHTHSEVGEFCEAFFATMKETSKRSGIPKGSLCGFEGAVANVMA